MAGNPLNTHIENGTMRLRREEKAEKDGEHNHMQEM